MPLEGSDSPAGAVPMRPILTYALITPARNEEEFIELTIQSVVAQTIRPVKWVIVSDGSTDRTDEIVARYAAQHDWIELVRMPERSARDFGGKVKSFNAGYARMHGVKFDIIGSLDADITFDESYFEFLLGKFEADPLLGVGGTPFDEGKGGYDYRFSSIEHVSGACQLFRKECYEAIGGYVPLKGGGIDVVAVMTARMKGWRTRSFTEKSSFHHRPMGTATTSTRFAASFNLGKRCYRLGWHPMWQFVRSFYQMTRKPYFTGGLALMLGYFWAFVQHEERPISAELIRFQRQEQMKRLKAFLHLGGSKAEPRRGGE